MRDEEGQLEVPEFHPNIPEHLLKGLPENEKWQLQQLSVQGQQNAWLINRAVKVDRKNQDIENRVNALEKFRDAATNKWSVIAAIASLIGIPLFIAWVTGKFGK